MRSTPSLAVKLHLRRIAFVRDDLPTELLHLGRQLLVQRPRQPPPLREHVLSLRRAQARRDVLDAWQIPRLRRQIWCAPVQNTDVPHDGGTRRHRTQTRATPLCRFRLAVAEATFKLCARHDARGSVQMRQILHAKVHAEHRRGQNPIEGFRDVDVGVHLLVGAHVAHHKVPAAGVDRKSRLLRGVVAAVGARRVASCEYQIQQRPQHAPGSIQQMPRPSPEVQHRSRTRGHPEAVAAGAAVASAVVADHRLGGALAVAVHRCVLVQLQQIFHDHEAVLRKELEGAGLPIRGLTGDAEFLYVQRCRRRRHGRLRLPPRRRRRRPRLGGGAREVLGQRLGGGGGAAEERLEKLRPHEGRLHVVVVCLVRPRARGRVVLLGAHDPHLHLWQLELSLPRGERFEDVQRILAGALLVAPRMRGLHPKGALVLAEAPLKGLELLDDTLRALRRHALEVALAVAVSAADGKAAELQATFGKQFRGGVRTRRKAEEAHTTAIDTVTANQRLHPRADQLHDFGSELTRDPAPTRVVVDEPPPARLPACGDEDEGLGGDRGPILVALHDHVFGRLAQPGKVERNGQPTSRVVALREQNLARVRARWRSGRSGKNQGSMELNDAGTHQGNVAAAVVRPAPQALRL
mmetsp:Transcript_122417/g.391682  ORF Transcript_122417/g.391682 Transcript_122417/m.391682 type:complete len:635 (+) Transcript_122417:74-1978(+)